MTNNDFLANVIAIVIFGICFYGVAFLLGFLWKIIKNHKIK